MCTLFKLQMFYWYLHLHLSSSCQVTHKASFYLLSFTDTLGIQNIIDVWMAPVLKMISENLPADGLRCRYEQASTSVKLYGGVYFKIWADQNIWLLGKFDATATCLVWSSVVERKEWYWSWIWQVVNKDIKWRLSLPPPPPPPPNRSP